MRRRLLLALATLVVAGLVGLSTTAVSWAVLTDTARAATGTFSATTLSAPTNARCNAGILGTGSITWTVPTTGPTPQGYEITYTNPYGGSGTVDLGPGVTTWRPQAGLLDLGTTYTITVQSLYGTNWESVPTAAVSVRMTSVAFINVFLTCP